MYQQEGVWPWGYCLWLNMDSPMRNCLILCSKGDSLSLILYWLHTKHLGSNAPSWSKGWRSPVQRELIKGWLLQHQSGAVLGQLVDAPFEGRPFCEAASEMSSSWMDKDARVKGGYILSQMWMFLPSVKNVDRYCLLHLFTNYMQRDSQMRLDPIMYE